MISRVCPPATNRLLLPLTALGTVTAVVLLKARFGRAVRRIINTVDNIQPTEEEVASSILHQSSPQTTPPLLPSQVEDYIQESDERPVVAGAERTVHWAKNSRHQKTRYAVVFLHGWGACRQECRPVPERIATAIGANLYCNRLPGHGRRHKRGRLGGGGPDGETLVDEAHPRALMESAMDALRVGLAIGDEVILVGMSTGGVLATWLATLPSVRPHIAGLVLISPAYALGHPLYPVLKHSFASLRLLPGSFGKRVRSFLIKAVIGNTKASPALSEEHQRYNSLVYPTEAILNLLDVLWTLETIELGNIDVPTIVFGNPDDHVTNFRVKATNAFLRFGEVPKALHCVTNSEHPHVIASEILSPSTVDEIADAAILFVKAHIVPDTKPTAAAAALLAGNQLPPPTKLLKTGRTRSVPTGMGSFASFSSLKDLTRPFEVG